MNMGGYSQHTPLSGRISHKSVFPYLINFYTLSPERVLPADNLWLDPSADAHCSAKPGQIIENKLQNLVKLSQIHIKKLVIRTSQE
ncbi:MAG TPA: hypothetical protein DCY42_06350 [Chloroflexi bacterium]|nr:hypothetical protein [Chloroflexota bacterium]